MIKITSITFLGFLVAIIPFMGIPKDWKDIFYIACGIAVISLSIMIRRELHEVLKALHTTDHIVTGTYTESALKKKD